jgi:hypothetical protein
MQGRSGGDRIPLKWADEEEETRAGGSLSFFTWPLFIGNNYHC